MIKTKIYLNLFVMIKFGIYTGAINLIALLKDVSANDHINI